MDVVRGAAAGTAVAHALSRVLRFVGKILYEIMLEGFLCLTKPSKRAVRGAFSPHPCVHAGVFLRFMGIISTVSRQLRYSPSRACVCLPPGFLTLWLYLPSCRFAHGYCRGLALCVFVICVCFARSPPGSLGFARSLRGFAQG